MSVLGLVLLVVQGLCFNIYMYELFWGNWGWANTRAFFYLTSTVLFAYRVLEEISGYKDNDQFQFNIISKSCFIVNFILFFLILSEHFQSKINYVLAFNGSFLVLSILILFGGLKHGYFKD